MLRGILSKAQQKGSGSASLSLDRSAFSPSRTIDLEISHPIRALQPERTEDGRDWIRTRVLITLHWQPIATVELPASDRTFQGDELASIIWTEAANAIVAHMREDGVAGKVSLTA